MSDTPPSEQRLAAERLAALFDGSTKGHGTHGEPTFDAQKNKWAIKSTAKTLRGAATIEMWEQHIKGERPLGPIPIRDDGKCIWGSIDVDQYNDEDNLMEIISRVKRAKVPLVPCRSKSGGLHLYVFLRHWTDASIVLPALKGIAASVGIANSEIFPKQTQLAAGNMDLGNWIIAPYFGSTYGGKLRLQVGIQESGGDMDLETFLGFAEDARIDSDELQKLGKPVRTRANGKAPVAAKDGELPAVAFSDGPPCLQHLIEQKLLSDGRKRAIFHMGVYYKKAMPETWEKHLQTANQEYMEPPLSAEELITVTRSLKKKDYQYTCKEEPMQSHCDSLQCRARRYGIGDGGNIPMISSMRKLNSDPPIWFVSMEGGGTIQCDTKQLQQYDQFHELCMQKLDRTYAPMKKADWWAIIDPQMRACQSDEAEKELGETGQFLEQLERYLTNRTAGDRMEDVDADRPWFDPEGIGKRGPGYYFSLYGFESFLQRQHVKLDKRIKTAQRVKELGGSNHQLNPPHYKSFRAWYIPASVIIPASPSPLPATKALPI